MQEAKFEILTSEASYLNSLRVLENEFVTNYELATEILTTAEKNKLFNGITAITIASDRFLAELEGMWRNDLRLTKLPEILLKHAENSLDLYVKFCSNQVNIDATLKELR